MVFWIGILVAAGFAWIAIKRGFYETWAMLFNIIIAVYLAIFVGPMITELVPASGEIPYGNIVAIVAAGAASFLILHGISYIFFTNQFSVPVPKIFDVLGAGLLGFLGGLLVWNFLALLVFLTPISQNLNVKDIGMGKTFTQSNITYVSWWCDRVNAIVAYKDDKFSSEQAINNLIMNIQNQEAAKQRQKNDPNLPIEPNKAAVKTAPVENKNRRTIPEVTTEDI